MQVGMVTAVQSTWTRDGTAMNLNLRNSLVIDATERCLSNEIISRMVGLYGGDIRQKWPPSVTSDVSFIDGI